MVFSPGTFGLIVGSFKPIIYGLAMAYLLDSVVMFLMKKLKVRRKQGIFLACVILIGIISTIIYKILPQIAENVNNIMDFIMDGEVDIGQIVADIRSRIDNKYVDYITDYILKAGESVKNVINNLLKYLYNTLMSLITNIGSGAFTAVTGFIINIYMLSEKDDLLARGRRFIHAYFNENKANDILNIFTKANKIFKSFLTGKLLDSTIVGIMCVIAFAIAKVPYAPLMGTLIGFFNMIPYFGPIIGSVPVVLVSFFVNPVKYSGFIVPGKVQSFNFDRYRGYTVVFQLGIYQICNFFINIIYGAGVGIDDGGLVHCSQGVFNRIVNYRIDTIFHFRYPRYSPHEGVGVIYLPYRKIIHHQGFFVTGQDLRGRYVIHHPVLGQLLDFIQEGEFEMQSCSILNFHKL
jgi:predicted PurR-regulated permease PerM